MQRSKHNIIIVAVLLALIIESLYLYISRSENWPYEYHQYDWLFSGITVLVAGGWTFIFVQEKLIKRIEIALITGGAYFVFSFLYVVIFLCKVVGDCL